MPRRGWCAGIWKKDRNKDAQTYQLLKSPNRTPEILFYTLRVVRGTHTGRPRHRAGLRPGAEQRAVGCNNRLGTKKDQ